MKDTQSSEDALANASREEIMSALFASMVIQQTNMALMLLGKIPHPETGKTMQDIESAKLFVDQLEMIEVKTRGNLDKQEERLLKQSLATLRLAFVEVIDSLSQPVASQPASEPAKPTQPASSPGAAGQPSAPPVDEDTRKKFSKRY